MSYQASVSRLPSIRVNPGAVLSLLKRHWLDLLLGLLALLSFSFFIYGYVAIESTTRVNAPLAKLAEGTALRKRHGATSFEKLAAGDDLFNMDAIWVDQGDGAIIAIGKARWKIAGSSLVILKRTFKRSLLMNGDGAVMQVIHGNIPESTKTLDDLNSLSFQKTPTRIENVDNIPTPKFTLEDMKAAAKHSATPLYPPPKLRIYEHSFPSPVIFSWPKKLSGFLVITQDETGEAQIFPLKETESQAVMVKNAGHYNWQIKGDNRKELIFGPPLPFEVEAATPEGVGALLKDTANKKAEVHW
jgi:hypothetical protein